MSNLIVEIHQYNVTKNYTIYFDTVESRFDRAEDLYRCLVEEGEYGRCTGKIYMKIKGKQVHVGWAFAKRMKYDDCDDAFLCHTWVSVLEEMPNVIREVKFKEL